MPYDLTPREMEVVRLVVMGLHNQEIANALFVSVLTVAAHLQHIMAKVGAETREDLVERLRWEGLG